MTKKLAPRVFLSYRKSMLRHRADGRSLIFILIAVASLLSGLFLSPGIYSLALIPFSTLACYICFTINHNQLHLGIFKSSAPNVLTNIVLSLCTGVPVTMIYLPHVQNHHAHPATEQDWAGAHLAGNHRGLWRALIYIARAQIAPFKHRPASLFHGLSSYRKISLCLESLVLAIFIVSALVVHPASFFLHILLPWVLSVNALILVNFALHDGCDYHSALHHSWTFTGREINFFLLNNGYHLAHHLNPKMHWSKLPDFHEKEIQLQTPDVPEKTSFSRHLFALYFFIPRRAKSLRITGS